MWDPLGLNIPKIPKPKYLARKIKIVLVEAFVETQSRSGEKILGIRVDLSPRRD